MSSMSGGEATTEKAEKEEEATATAVKDEESTEPQQHDEEGDGVPVHANYEGDDDEGKDDEPTAIEEEDHDVGNDNDDDEEDANHDTTPTDQAVASSSPDTHQEDVAPEEEDDDDIDNEQHYERPPLPPIPSPTIRANIHAELRAFEAQRRSAHTSKLESSWLYWRSFRDLLLASVQETARAERLLLGTARAHRLYADAMRASHDDAYVDDRGHVVMDAKRRERLQQQRQSSAKGMVEAASHEAGGAAAAVAAPLSAASSSSSSSGTTTKRPYMLKSLIDSQLVLSERFAENASHLETEIATEIAALRTELFKKVESIQGLGDAILQELEKTEAEVAKAWEDYFAMASRSVGGSSSSSHHHGHSPGASDTEHCTDVWVVEMQYRVAVSYQTLAWDKGSAELSRLFASMKETECKRRIDLREFLVAFVQRQERLILSLPDVYTPVLKDLVGRDMDRNTIEETVQASIRKRAEIMQREESKNKPPPKPGSGLTGVRPAAAEDMSNFRLESPLMSELLCKAKVVERKVPGVLSSWKTTLAIVTADSFLHLFDVPNASRVHNGSAPEVAFQSLIPTVKIPTAGDIKTGNMHFVQGWCDLLTPVASMSLINCSITTGLNDPNGAAFEIVEKMLSTGATKMLGKKITVRKFMLRTVTSKETEDWIAALRAQKYVER